MGRVTVTGLLILCAMAATMSAFSACREWPTEARQERVPPPTKPDTTKACKEDCPMSMSNDEIRKTLKRAARGELSEPPTHDVGYILSLYNQVFRGEIAEFKAVSTRRGVDVFVTKKRRL